MDKYEYKLKTEQMLELMEEGSYRKAAELADEIDWRKVRNITMLMNVSDIYEKNGEYQKSYEVLNDVYRRAEGSRKVIYRLCTLALKTGNVDEAIDFYDDFMQIAPKDPNQYILRYQILRAQRAPVEQQIEALEEFKKSEYIEEWAYELAKLYQEAGMTAECLEECDDLILWFSEGKYVYKAMELKMQYKPLTPSQQEKYDRRFEKLSAETEEMPNLEAFEENQEEQEEPEVVEDAEIIEEPETAEEKKGPEPAEESIPEVAEAGEPRKKKIGDTMRLDEALQKLLHREPEPEVVETESVSAVTTAETQEDAPDVEDIELTEDAEDLDEELDDSLSENVTADLWDEPETEEVDEDMADLEDAIGEIESVADLDIVNRIAEEKAAKAAEANSRISTAGAMKEIIPEETVDEIPEDELPEAGADEAPETEKAEMQEGGTADLTETAELVLAEAEEFLDERLAVEAASPEADTSLTDASETDKAGKNIEDDEENTASGDDDQIAGQMSLEDILAGWDSPQEPEAKPEPEVEKAASEPEAKAAPEKVEEKPEVEKAAPEPEAKSEPEPEVKAEPEKAEEEPEVEKVAPEPEAKPEPKPVEKAEPEKAEEKPEIEKAAPEPEAKSEPEPEVKAEPEKAEEEPEVEKAAPEPEAKAEPETEEEILDVEEAEELPEESTPKKKTEPILPPDIQRMIDEIEGVIPPEEPKPKAPAKKADEPRENMGKVAEELRIDDEFELDESEDLLDDEELFDEEDEVVLDEGEALEDSDAELVDDGEELEDSDAELLDDGEELEDSEAELIDDAEELEDDDAEILDDGEELEDDDAELLDDGEEFEESDEDLLADAEEFEESGDDLTADTKDLGDFEFDDEGAPDLEEEFRVNPEHSNEPDDREIPDDDDDMDILSATTPLSRKETAKLIATGKTAPLPLDEISDALSMSDTGFIVHGRYDLEMQSGIGTRAGLTEEQKKLFSYFVPVRGMSEQLVDVLEQDKNCTNREGTSRTGNLLIIGNKGNGKTVLAVDVVKAIQKQRNIRQGKVAIVTGESLNKKKIGDIFEKLYGGALIIEKAGKMNEKTVARLNKAMEKDTGELLIVLEEQRKPLDRLLSSNREFRRKFTCRLEVPIFINDELVTFGQTYAQENGYRIDEMGILALYSRIDSLQREDHAVTVAEVKEIMDEAIRHSQKASAKKLVRRVFGKNTDEADRILLSEKDFNV